MTSFMQSLLELSGPRLRVIENTGKGPTVVFLHGIASSSAAWKYVLPLASTHHHCITLDLVGFGTTPAPKRTGYTLDEQVAALRRTLKSLKLRQPFVLVGHSMGALIAARYAARYPKTLKRLVMVAPPIYLQPAELSRPLERVQMDFYLKAYRYLRENKQFTIRNAAFIKKLLPVPESLVIDEAGWDAFVASLQNLIESQTTLNDLATTTAPTTVFYGTLDPLTHTGVLKIVGRLEGVELRAVNGEGHVIGKRMAQAVVESLGGDPDKV